MRLSRVVRATCDQNRINNGCVLTIVNNPPHEWTGGDSIDISFADGNVVLYAEPDSGLNLFSYQYRNYASWLIELEPIEANEAGWPQLRVKLTDAHENTQRADDEAGR